MSLRDQFVIEHSSRISEAATEALLVVGPDLRSTGLPLEAAWKDVMRVRIPTKNRKFCSTRKIGSRLSDQHKTLLLHFHATTRQLTLFLFLCV